MANTPSDTPPEKGSEEAPDSRTERTYAMLDRPEVLAVLFHPRRDALVPRLASGVHTVRLPVAEDIHVGGKLFVAKPDAPVIVYFHGNGEIASDYDMIAPLYLSLGLSLLVFDYRGYGRSDDRPTSSALIADARACYEQVPAVLARHGIAPQRPLLMGRSLGSAAVLEIVDTAEDPPAALIIESGFAYTFALIERIGNLRIADADEDRDGFGNLEKMGRANLPTLVIHGDDDWIIPVDDGLALYERSPAADKRLVTVPGAGHNDLMMVGRQAYFQSIAELSAAVARR